MSNLAMKARVTHIGLLREITRASDILDSIEEETDRIRTKNFRMGRSSDPNIGGLSNECREIESHLNDLDGLIMEMTDVLHEMDNMTLDLLKNSI